MAGPFVHVEYIISQLINSWTFVLQIYQINQPNKYYGQQKNTCNTAHLMDEGKTPLSLSLFRSLQPSMCSRHTLCIYIYCPPYYYTILQLTSCDWQPARLIDEDSEQLATTCIYYFFRIQRSCWSSTGNGTTRATKSTCVLRKRTGGSMALYAPGSWVA